MSILQFTSSKYELIVDYLSIVVLQVVFNGSRDLFLNTEKSLVLIKTVDSLNVLRTPRGKHDVTVTAPGLKSPPPPGNHI